jgi:hypothetical protein
MRGDEPDICAEIRMLLEIAKLEAERREQEASDAQNRPNVGGFELRVAKFDHGPTGTPPRYISEIQAAVENPLRQAIRSAIREIGWRLYAKGGTKAMRSADNELTQQGVDSRFLNVVDKAWNAIGFDNDKRGTWWS